MKQYSRGTAITDKGLVREKNDDAVAYNEEIGYYAVADGMGRMPHAREAAWMCVDAVGDKLEELLCDNKDPYNETEIAQAYKRIVEEVSNDLYQQGNLRDNYHYGTTFCGALVMQEKIAIVSIGDSRAYTLDPEEITFKQVTEDENLAGLVVREGLLTYSEAKKRGMASQLINFVGISQETKASLFLLDRSEVKRILLCTDGLHGMLSDADILSELKAYEAEKTCRMLIKDALAAGGKDNVSVAIIDML